ncbi:MAG: bifunctional 4-hydroxy-2-oxoglutarate aldolase/2-dehydro-3-deoxy-phosphogluconate aldolase [Ferruginibacter sp.]
MNKAIQHIIANPVVPVFYNDDLSVCRLVFEACHSGGIRVFEFTNRGAKALENFVVLKEMQQQQFPDLLLGAGTVVSGKAAEQYLNAGASFLVSPFYSQAVFDICYRYKIPYIPGCMTVKEIAEANDAGCEMIKVFPGEVVGIAFIKAVKAVLPDVKLLVTGGVNEKNCKDWRVAGADALGIGGAISSLVSSPLLISEKFKAIIAATLRN